MTASINRHIERVALHMCMSACQLLDVDAGTCECVPVCESNLQEFAVHHVSFIAKPAY